MNAISHRTTPFLIYIVGDHNESWYKLVSFTTHKKNKTRRRGLGIPPLWCETDSRKEDKDNERGKKDWRGGF